MKYSVRRFSYQESLSNGNEYILAQVDSGLGKIDDLTTVVIEDPKLGNLKPVKKHVKLVRDLSRLFRREKKKHKEKKYSQDPTITINTAEANKFKVAMNRLTNSMGTDPQNLAN